MYFDYVPPHGGVFSVQRRRVRVASTSYGSALWEAREEELRETLRANGLPEVYHRGLFGDSEADKLIAQSPGKVQAQVLRSRRAGR